MLDVVNQRVESYLKKQAVQFDKWKKKDLHKDSVFIEDGIVNPDCYFSSENRILFLLKEAYSKKDDKRPLTDWLNDEKERITPIWRRVSEWAELIVKELSENDEKIIFYRDSKFNYNGNEFLRKIAVVNVKKSNGKPSSKPEELMEYVDKDNGELLEQLQLCDPTIIVCGNVEYCLKEIIKNTGEKLVEVDRDHYIYRFNLNGHNVLVISYWHPANRYPHLMNYYGFANVCKIAIEKNR